MMEKHTGREVRVFQIDNVGDYKDKFLQFRQNGGIGIHFSIRKLWVAKEMNISLMEKFWCYCLMHK